MNPSHLALRHSILAENNTTKQEFIAALYALPKIPRVVRPLLRRYYILYWDSEYFASQVIEGTITHDSVRYQIAYGDSYRPNIRKTNFQVAVSFRQPLEEFGIQPIAYVRSLAP